MSECHSTEGLYREKVVIRIKDPRIPFNVLKGGMAKHETFSSLLLTLRKLLVQHVFQHKRSANSFQRT